MKVNGWLCDVCGATSGERLFPLDWKRIHVWGRPEGEGYMGKVSTADVCSVTCAKKAVE